MSATAANSKRAWLRTRPIPAPCPPDDALRLTRTALDEVEAILDGALAYGGADHVRKVRDRFERLFDILDDGVGPGTGRPELRLGDDVRFVSTTPYPFLVIYDRLKSLILRVIPARRDYRDLVLPDRRPV